MKTSYILAGIVIAVVVIGGVFLFQSNNNVQMPSLSEEENMMPPLGEQVQSSPMVTYTNEGYSPKELLVKKGDIVTFKNESSVPMWTASAMHPNHTAYPGTNIANCGNAMMMDTMFDSCAEVPAGQVWKFQFNEAGEWGYHNHMQASHWGKIIVQ
jgi:plastocyanin